MQRTTNMTCNVTVHHSPFGPEEKRILKQLANTSLCHQNRSSVNSDYIEDLILEVCRATEKDKYALIISTTTRGAVGAFGVLETNPDAFYQVKKQLVSEGSVLDLICADNARCQGKAVMEKVRQYLRKRNKKYIFLESLSSNFTYYIKKWGAFSIDGAKNMKFSKLLCDQPKTPAVEEELSKSLDEYSLRRPKRYPGVFPLVIDLTTTNGTLCIQATAKYRPFLAPRVCEGRTAKQEPCRNVCQNSQKYCHVHTASRAVDAKKKNTQPTK